MDYIPPLGGAPGDPYIDGNIATGIEGSIPPAASIEYPMREIVNAITAAGLAPSDADLTQMLEAVRRMAGGHVSTITGQAGGTAVTLTLANAGLVLVDATAGAVTITLPAANALAAVPYHMVRVDGSANAVSIAAAGTDTINAAASVDLVGQYSELSIKSDGIGTWRNLGAGNAGVPFLVGDAVDPQEAVALGQFTSGTGWQVLPNGHIMQWGTATAGLAGTSVTNAFPIAFPTAVFSIQAVHMGSNQTVNIIVDWVLGITNLTSFGLRGTYTSDVEALWVAIGN